MSTQPRLPERLLGLLVRVYPQRFRARFGAELLALHRSERARIAQRHGTTAAWRFDARTIAAALSGAIREWAHDLRRSGAGAPRHGRGSGRSDPGRWTIQLGAVVTEARYALRGLRRDPGFALVVILTLGLSAGASAAMFETVDQLLLRPPPYLRDAASVHTLYFARTRNDVRRMDGSFSYPMFRALGESVEGFETVAASAFREQVAALGDRPRKLLVMGMSGSMWSLFDVAPAHGRFFGPDEDLAPRGSDVAVLSYDFWRAEYGRDPEVLGRTLTLASKAYTVVGVAPERFRGMGIASPQVFVPLAAAAPTFIGDDFAERAGTTFLNVVVRTGEGGEAAALASATRVIVGQYVEFAGEERAREFNIEAMLQPLLQNRGPYPRPEARFSLWMLGMSSVVYLVACANVATLMTGRALRRRRETAVRAALGVPGGRIVMLPLLEGAVLAIAAAVLAVPVGQITIATLSATLLPDGADALRSLAPRSVLFGAALLVSGGLLAALLPALHARRVHLGQGFRTPGGGSGRARSRAQVLLPVVQAALSALLLVAAGLFVRSVQHAANLELGYDADRVLLVDAEGSGAFDAFKAAEELGFSMDELLSAANTVPGAQGVALSTAVPFHSNNIISFYLEDGTPAPGSDGSSGACTGACSGGDIEYAAADVTPGYFDVAGTRILLGRGFVAGDLAGAEPVIVVSESLARRAWPSPSPPFHEALGKCGRTEPEAGPCARVVGVAEDIRRGDIRSDLQLLVYRPWEQVERSLRGAMLVRAAGRAENLAEPIRQRLQALVPASVHVRVEPLAVLVGEQTRNWRVGARLFGAFGGLALAMAAIGLFSVVTFEVGQRRREFGVRVALGARAIDLVRLVMRKGVLVTAGGVAVGLALALALAGRLEGLLFVDARDPLTFALVGMLLLAAAATASLLPAMRASRVEPQRVLRSE